MHILLRVPVSGLLLDTEYWIILLWCSRPKSTFLLNVTDSS
jgi:hypothetical protein